MNMYGTANYRERFCELYQKNSRKANDDRIWELVGTKLSQGHFALYESRPMSNQSKSVSYSSFTNYLL